jgi:hypothetical protein
LANDINYVCRNGMLTANPITQQYTRPTVTLGISIPDTLRVAIMTAVPGSVIVDLMNESRRSQVASQFAAGNTPQWYAVCTFKPSSQFLSAKPSFGSIRHNSIKS